MHQRLSEILGQEVVGEITRVGDTRTHFDVGLGRVCLEQLQGSRVEEMVARLRETLGGAVEVRDRLHLKDTSKLVRGLVEVTVADEALGSSYLLQITSASLCAFYERRFVLEPGLYGDLMGVICRGLSTVFQEGREAPLRQISAYDELLATYLEQLDAVIQASVAGQTPDQHGLRGLAAAAHDCWQMLPWPLRCQLRPASDMAGQRLASLDSESNRTVLVAANVAEGAMVHEYTHQHHDLEDQEDVLGWISEVHQILAENYTPPAYQCAVARASSVPRFVACFPRFQQVLVRDEEPS